MIAEYYMIYKIMNKFLFAMKKIIMKKMICLFKSLLHRFTQYQNNIWISNHKFLPWFNSSGKSLSVPLGDM